MHCNQSPTSMNNRFLKSVTVTTSSTKHKTDANRCIKHKMTNAICIFSCMHESCKLNDTRPTITLNVHLPKFSCLSETRLKQKGRYKRNTLKSIKQNLVLHKKICR